MPFDVPVVVAKLPINARDGCVSGHVVWASNSRLSRMRHRNALNEKAWEHTVQGLGLNICWSASVEACDSGFSAKLKLVKS